MVDRWAPLDHSCLAEGGHHFLQWSKLTLADSYYSKWKLSAGVASRFFNVFWLFFPLWILCCNGILFDMFCSSGVHGLRALGKH